ncbi:MAG: hypothetical protein IKE53_02095 [Clostridiales bacterium]|nr:hypothetical protein [Clostridiales bacterium]
MKKCVASIALISAMFLQTAALTGCTEYYNANEVTRDNMVFITSDAGNKAFVWKYIWDGDIVDTYIEIPDEIDGFNVVRLGGFTGIGVPHPFEITTEDEPYFKGADPEKYDVPVTFDDLVFTVEIGENITDLTIPPYYVGVKQPDGSIIFYDVHLVFIVDEDNSKFYAEDGILYNRKDDSVVEGISYGNRRAED